MQYTFKQAKEDLTSLGEAYGTGNLDQMVNKALRALSTLSSWQRLRRVLRFVSVGPCFTLPQGCAGLVRVCVNGRPVTLRGQDFRFLHSGPGDRIWRVPPGFVEFPVKNVLDNGFYPIMEEPPGLFRLFAYTDSTEVKAGTTGTSVEPNLRVTGVDPTGRHLVVSLPVLPLPVYGEDGATLVSGVLPDEVEPDPHIFARVDSVVLGEGATEYVTLFATDIDASQWRRQIALYNPTIRAPSFRRYELAGYPHGKPVELLVETRLDFVTLVNDNDVLPFSSVEPIEMMIRSDWALRSGEPSQAQTYREQAMQWLAAQQAADETVQTQVVVNSIFEGSPGEISLDAENV